MGQAIVYCFRCCTRLLGADFRKGKAYEVGHHPSCSSCAAEMLPTLEPGQREALLAVMFKATQDRSTHS